MDPILMAAAIIIIVGLVLYFLLDKSPFDGPIKAIGLWAIVAIVVIALLVQVVIPLLHSI